jgi:type II secretory pathway component GspD/PulD (secretin)
MMALCIILLFTPQTYSQMKGRIKTFHITGKVDVPGATMQGLPGTPAPTTDDNGVYSVDVRYGWSGTVTPVKPGYTFEPKQRAYSNVTEDKNNEDYVGTMQTFIIAGTTGQAGVKLRGLPDDPNSGPDGRYSVKVPFGFTGSVTPEFKGYQFEPVSREYTQLNDDKKADNYTARVQTFAISGSAGAEGVLMKGFPTEVKTNKDGTYKAEVPFEWSGKVSPTKEGYEFIPELKEYSAVIELYANADYQARVFTFEISGSAGMAGVVMAGLPGEPISDLDGRYTATVEYGWFGKITPTKAGYSFKPAVTDVPKVIENKQDLNFAGAIMKYTISGTTGIGGVKLTGLPTEVTCTASGSYSVQVEYGWTGTITPDKEGYTFDPATLLLGPIEKDLSKQDFKAKAVTCTISGNVGLAGVMLGGLPGRIVSGADGGYATEVAFKWNGSVTPMKEGYVFDPVKKPYENVTESATSENYTATIKQYTISGRITSEKGPLADVFIMTDKQGVTAMTTANGEFTLNVDHGFQCKLTPTKDGCTFTPPVKPVGPVFANLTNQSFTGKMRMVTISDVIEMVLEEGKPAEPIQGVTIADKTGTYTAVTDAKGRYSVQVPYDWSGELVPTKPGIDFDPPSILHEHVTENIGVAPGPKPPAAPDTKTVKPGAAPTEPTIKPAPITTPAGGTIKQPPATGTTPKAGKTAAEILAAQGEDKTAKPAGPTPALTEKQRLEQQIEALRRQLGGTNGKLDVNALPGGPSPEPIRPSEVPSNTGPIVSGTFAGTVIEVLTQISQRTGAKVYADATVKPDPIQPVTITAMPMASALPMILKGTKYTFLRVEKPEEAWQVFLPISNSFSGDKLPRALQDISLAAGVPIVPDEAVTGDVYADLQGVPLEMALETILAGTPYVVKKTPNYYLVADRKVEGSAFDKISETRTVRLNYIAPAAAKSLLSTAFSPYIQAETDPNSHIVTVTAPAALADRIAKELKNIDIRPRHVLLDARIVAMDRGDMLNIGVEWGMPTASAGFFGNAYEHGTKPVGDADPAGMWPWGVQVGLTFDKAFTNQLTAALNLLKENNKVDIISSPQVMGRDGKRSRIQVITEEYFMMSAPVNQNMFYSQSQLETVKSGTTLEITPLVGDNNDITLELAVEVSDSIPKGRGSDLPVVTRRTAQNSVTIRDGGTVAVAGLTENRTREKESRVPGLGGLPLIGRLFRNSDSDKATREIAIFVTAHLVPETSMVTGQMSGGGNGGRIMSPAGDSFRQELKDSMSR